MGGGGAQPASGRGRDPLSQVGVRESSACSASLRFHCAPGPCHVAEQTLSGIGGRLAGWGLGAGAGTRGSPRPLGATPRRTQGRRAPPSGPAGGGPGADTHRPAVLLQRHQLAPDVDSLEVIEVLLPLRTGRGRQEQPRRQQCSHHDSIPRWPRGEGKAWGERGGGEGG